MNNQYNIKLLWGEFLAERVVISPTSRQEGHAELVMEVDDEGIVTKGYYFSITPVRGLENGIR